MSSRGIQHEFAKTFLFGLNFQLTLVSSEKLGIDVFYHGSFINSVPTVHRSLPLVIPTFIESAMFFPSNESDMRWHAIFIIKLPYVIGTLHSFFSYEDTISL